LIGIINALIFVSAVIIRQVSPGFVPDIIGKRIRKLR
jgi:hypothetical protein